MGEGGLLISVHTSYAYFWLVWTEWQNEFQINYLLGSFTCHRRCMPTIDMHVMHVVWKWIQISRITYVNVISPTDRAYHRDFADRLLLRHPTRCLTNVLLLFFLSFSIESPVYLICSCVISYNVVMCCNQDNVYNLDRSRDSDFRSERMDRHVDAFYSSWIRISKQQQKNFFFLAFKLLRYKKKTRGRVSNLLVSFSVMKRYFQHEIFEWTKPTINVHSIINEKVTQICIE